MNKSFSINDDFTRILLGSQRQLYQYILTMVPRLTDADEILQETNAVLLRKRDDFRLGTSFSAWACKIAHYEVLAYRKRQSRAQRIIHDDALLATLAAESVVSGSLNARLAALQACIEKLRQKDSLLVDMRYRQGLSSEQMATCVGSTADAVRRQLFRVRTALLGCIEKGLGKTEYSA